MNFQASHIDYLGVMVCLMVASAGRMMKMKKKRPSPAKITNNLDDLGYPPISGSPLKFEVHTGCTTPDITR